MSKKAASDLSRLRTLARSRPREALEEGDRMLREIGPDRHGVRSKVLRAMSVAARAGDTMEVSIRHAREAVIEAGLAEDDEARMEAAITLAGSLAISGDTAGALEALARDASDATGPLAAEVSFQKASILAMAGYHAEAIESYGEALPDVLAHPDPELEALIYKNRGWLLTQSGELAAAESELQRSLECWTRLGAEIEVGNILHNLGLVAAYRGDIPLALERLTESDETFMRHSGWEAPNHWTRAEVLISAGQFEEALDLALEVAAANRAAGRGEDEADATLVAAQAALLSADHPAASHHAASAASLFMAQGRESAAARARVVELEAMFEADGPGPDLIRQARAAARSLERERLFVAAASARLLAGRAALDTGDLKSAIADLAKVANVSVGPVEIRLQAWLAKAMVRRARGETRGAYAAARAGIRLLDDLQGGLGATELRTGVEKQARELGELGLGLARDSGKPTRVFDWMERSRARALRHPPVLPTGQLELDEALAELRLVSSKLRDGPDPALERTKRALQEKVRRLSRAHRGPGEGPEPYSRDRLVEALGSRLLVEYGALDGPLFAVSVHEGRFRRHELGSRAEALAELEHLRFAMRVAAVQDRGLERVERAARRLGEMLVPSGLSPGAEMVIVPTPELMATPWPALPALRDRVVTVAPSAEIWLRAAGIGSSRQSRALVVGGPELVHVYEELDLVSAAHGDCVVLAPGEATAERVLLGAGEAGVAHFACHAHFNAGNPMFSALQLGDGDLSLYDLQKLGQAPHTVVLSACDSGYSESRSGEELMGLASALLGLRSANVLASVGLVPDIPGVAEMMGRVHTGLVRGARPAAALVEARARPAGTPRSFVASHTFLCVGAG